MEMDVGCVECYRKNQNQKVIDELIPTLVQRYSGVLLNRHKSGFRGRVRRSKTNDLETSTTFGCPATASLALDCLVIALDHDHDHGRPLNNFTYNDFRGRYNSEVNLIKKSDEVSAKLKVRSDLVSIVDALVSVLKNFNDTAGKPSWKKSLNPNLVAKVRRNLEEFIQSERDGTTNGKNEFFWSAEKPLDHSEYERLQSQPDDNPFDLRKEDRAICSFYCDKSTGGGYVPPSRFKSKPNFSTEQTMRRRRNMASYAARCIFDSQWLDHNESFRPYLSEVQQNAPNKIPTEEKKCILLKYLWDQGIVRRNVIPSFCLPTDDFSLNARDKEKEAFYEDITPQLLSAKAGHDEELDKCKSDVSAALHSQVLFDIH